MTTGKFPPETVFQSKEYFQDRESKLKQQIADLQAKNRELHLDIQTYKEFFVHKDKLADLLIEIDRLKAIISTYEEEVDGPDDIRELKKIITDYKGAYIENGKLKSDKRELVSVLEYAARFVRDADMEYIRSAISKHKEGL